MYVTVCTPTYNRAYTLPRLYNSLLEQTDKDFEWIIIDDGSDDNTKEIVKDWIEERRIHIQYIYQKNQGKHVALNKGMELARGILFTCLDSDDWFYKDTIHTVKMNWIENQDNKVGGIIALDTFENGKVIGTNLPKQLTKANWIDLVYKYKMNGDKAYFFRTDIIRNIPFPVFKDNKHMPPSYQYYLFSKEYDLILLNEPVKYVEYLDDGISKNKYRKYLIAPDNFSFYRLEIMNQIPSFRRRIINAIHYNSTKMIGKRKFKIKKTKDKVIIGVTKPFGFLLYLLIMIKNKQ